MDVKQRVPGDLDRLYALIRAERGGAQRDRYRMVVLALEGEEKLRIAGMLGVAKSTVETWVYRYRDGGIEALAVRKQPGAACRLTPERCGAFRRRIINGPLENDGVCTLRGKDGVRILNDEFGVGYSLQAAYDLMHRLGLSCLSPRPRHEKNDPAAMEAFKRCAPLLSSG